MNTPASLASFLSQPIKATSAAFWSDFKALLANPKCFEETLPVKSKQKLIEVIQCAVTSQEWLEYSSVVVSWLTAAAQTSFFDDNFKKEDQIFFVSLGPFVEKTLSKSPSQELVDLKMGLLSAFENLFAKSAIVKQEALSIFVKSAITVFKNKNEIHCIIAKVLSMIYRLLNENEILVPTIQASSQILFDAAKEIRAPKTQMQLFNILWIAEARVKDASFVHKSDALFISSVHKIAAKFNNGIKSFIISLPFQSTVLPDGTSIGVGWIDIGDIDFILCFDEKILNIPFEAVSGLDSEGNTMTFLIDERYKEFGDHPNQSLIIKLSRKPTSKMTTQIFSRVSRGESQPHISDGDEYEVDENIKVNPPEKIVPNETAPIISPHHSSTAMAVPKNISQNASNITQSNMQLNAKPNINTNVDTNQGNQPNEKQQTKVINFGNLGNDNGNPATKMMKSSIAMYYNFDAQPKSQSSQLDECLFTDESATMATESTEAVKSSIPDPESTEANSTIANDNEFDSIASPPPPSIAIDLRTDPQNEPENENENDTEIENEEPESVKVVEKEKETKVVKGLRQIQKKTTTSPPKKETKSKKISKFESEQDEIISRHTERVSEKITAGIDALTKQRMDSIDNFEGQIARYVDSFKDDIKTTLQDREHGSINQIEASKQKFQNNIQQFKKKEGLMHQTLTGIEEENKQMSSKITGIQRTMRDKTQQLRLDLENELKNLRKKVRRKDTIRDNSDDFDEDFLDDLPKLKSRYITA